MGLGTPSGVARALTVPACAVCSASIPVLAGVGAALPVGVAWLGVTTHWLLFVLAPLNLYLLWRSSRGHGNRTGLVLAAAGVLLIAVHLLGHLGLLDAAFGTPTGRVLRSIPRGWDSTRSHWALHELAIWVGSALLLAGSIIDMRARWRARSEIVDCKTPEEYWDRVLTGSHPGLREARWILGALPKNPRCKLCNAPFAGFGAPLMRVIGKAQSTKNPQFCTGCLRNAPEGGAEIELTLMFADVRGSSGIAERMTSAAFMRAMKRFYDVAQETLTRHDALIDKFVGDEVVALFIPAFAGPEHARRAIDAGRELVRNAPADLPVGVGVHTGTAFVGLIGAQDGPVDLTALGDAVNVAARLASLAAAGELLVSDATLCAAGGGVGSERRALELKGRAGLIEVAVLHAN